MAKSYRRCEIVSQIDDECGNNLFDLDNMNKILEEKMYIKRYAYIFHDKDVDKEGKLVKKHIHLILEFSNPVPTKNIANIFKVKENFIEKIKSKKFEDAFKYLLHINAPNKYQYNIEEVFSNFNILEVIQKKDNKEILEETIDKILAGDIKEYEKTIVIDAKFYTFHKRIIDEAFKTYNDHRRNTETKRKQKVIFITGEAGSGKTTLAKKICENLELTYFISSSSNDVFDGYCNQPAVILDDMRPSSFGLSDLLKLLDNNSSTSVKSRYRNPYVNCDLIIITTVLDIDTFYRNVFSEEQESSIQFKRRCEVHVRVTDKYIFVSYWNSKEKKYSEEVVMKNDLIEKFVEEQTSKTVDDKIDEYMPFLHKLSEKEIIEAHREKPFFNMRKISDREFDRIIKGENGKA